MTEQSVRYIDVEYSESAMFGSTDPDDENIDVAASLDAFDTQLTPALHQHYPHAKIRIQRGINDTHSAQEADGFPLDDDTAVVGHIISQVHGSWHWLRYND